jgi:hypothetical protein
MSRPTNLASLADAEWGRLEDILESFEDAWRHAGAAADKVDIGRFLPPADDPLRPVAIQELVKSDIEARWRRDIAVEVESYTKRFPELIQAGSVPVALLYEEYRVRQRFGDRIGIDVFQRRFPREFGELQQLLETHPVAVGASTTKTKLAPPTKPTSPSDPVTAQVLPTVSGYRLIHRINRGSFGDVWRAEAPGGVEVALKIIYGSVAANQAQRELHALDIIKHLHHPFLLPIHAYWQMDDRLVIAMELADGCLRDRQEEYRRKGQPGIPLEELMLYIREAAEAIDYLHTKRVMHRDIKPENILCLQGHAKVGDFDLARLVEQTRQLSSASDCGTPAYTAPEVFWRGKVGAGSDQYSLAVTYAELRLNRPLFSSRNWMKLMHDHLQRSPDLVPLLDSEQRVLRRALAKDAEERFPSCREFAQALERSVPR